jgi:hypothetical protein
LVTIMVLVTISHHVALRQPRRARRELRGDT